jgi:ferredoxin
MDVRVDPAKCQAYGQCKDIAPEVFKLDEWGFAYVELDGPVASELQTRLEDAARACPEDAITVSEAA